MLRFTRCRTGMGPACAVVLVLALLGGAGFAQRTTGPPEPLPQNGAAQAPFGTPPPPAGAASGSSAAPNPEAIPGQQFTPAPASKPTYDPAEAKHDIDVGNFYYNRGAYPGALARFQDALLHDQHATEAMFRAGETELKLNAVLPARQYWQQYLSVDPNGKFAAKARKELAHHPNPDAAPAARGAGK